MSDGHIIGSFFGPSTFVELLRHRALMHGDQIAFSFLVDGENEQIDMTYADLDRQARAIAAWLESHGLVGQKALLLYPAGLEFIAAFFGCLYAGVVAIPVYPPRRNRSLIRIQAIAEGAKAKVALTTNAVLQRVESLVDETPYLKRLTWLATSEVPPESAEEWTEPDIDGKTLAFLQFTSGSTGMPKGVMLSHSNLLHNSGLISYAYEHTRSSSGVFWLPSYHDMGLIGGILQPIYCGGRNVLMSPMNFLQKPYRWLSAITRFGATTSGGPNFAYDLCVERITPEQRETLDLSSWQVAFNGAEPIRAETLDAFCEAFEPCGFRREAFYPCYGLAEATLIVSGGRVKEKPIVREFDNASISDGLALPVAAGTDGAYSLVSSGRKLPDGQVVIADYETHTRCPESVVGEIWISSPSVAQGYFNQPEATHSTFRARLKDTGEGPFLRTGDLGFLFDGELFITGRIKDMLIVHGVNHYPQDIELTIQQSHERLRRDCGAAFTVEVRGKQELIIAQEIERHRTTDFSDVFDAIYRAVASEHDLHPYAILLLKAGTIPKTSSGKIQRHACRAEYLKGELSVVGQWTMADGSPLKLGNAEPRRSPRKELVGNGNGNGNSNGHGNGHAAGPAPKETRRGGEAGGSRIPTGQSTVEVVIEEINRVAGDRAKGLTMDTPIVETGLDSLERMEILSLIEERFGGRFPEEIYAELETARDLVAAVEKHLGGQTRAHTERPADYVTPPEHYRIQHFPECVKLQQTFQAMESLGMGNPYFMQHEGITNDRTRIGGRELISFATYNYLGMSGDPAVSEATKAAIDRFGTSASASRLVSGEKTLHAELERAIADFAGAEDAVVFVGGHATNETVIGHLLGPGDLILHDALAHNSIVQGCILSGARRRPFPHNDWAAADRLLQEYRHEYRRVLIAIEGVYSMDGDIPDLPRFIEVKNRHNALLMVDEAHSMGVLGKTGRGIAEYCGVNRADGDIWMGTLSKSFGSCGGYIAGSRALVQYLKYTAPGFVFSAAIAPPAAAAAMASLAVLKAQPERVARLRENSALFLSLARERGMNTGMSHDSPVVPIILGNSVHSLRLSHALFERGVNVQPILHPAVEEKAARLRYFITSCHTPEQIRYTVEVTAEELEKIDPAHLRAAEPTAK